MRLPDCKVEFSYFLINILLIKDVADSSFDSNCSICKQMLYLFASVTVGYSWRNAIILPGAYRVFYWDAQRKERSI